MRSFASLRMTRGGPGGPRSGKRSATSRHLAFVEPRHQLGEIAGPESDVELLAQDVIPAVLAGAGRARQGEDVGGVGAAGDGARLQGRGADLLRSEERRVGK